MDTSDLSRGLALIQDADFLYCRNYLERKGFSLRTDGSKARAWCLEQAAQGDTEATYVAAALLSAGLFGSMEKIDSYRLCSSAAAKDFAPALLLLASFYELGWADVEIDVERARALIEKAAAKGYVPAIAALGQYHLSMNKTSEGHLLAMKYLDEAASRGHAPSQATLASQLLSIGGEDNINRGIQLLERAAENDYAHAHRLLSGLHRGLHGLSVDQRKAKFHRDRADEIEFRDGL